MKFGFVRVVVRTIRIYTAGFYRSTIVLCKAILEALLTLCPQHKPRDQSRIYSNQQKRCRIPRTVEDL